MSYQKIKDDSTLVTLDEWVEVPELGMAILVEKSQHGEQTRVYWAKKRRIQHRHLTGKAKKE